MCLGMMLCTQAMVVSLCMFDSRKIRVDRSVAVRSVYMYVHAAG